MIPGPKPPHPLFYIKRDGGAHHNTPTPKKLRFFPKNPLSP